MLSSSLLALIGLYAATPDQWGGQPPLTPLQECHLQVHMAEKDAGQNMTPVERLVADAYCQKDMPEEAIRYTARKTK